MRPSVETARGLLSRASICCLVCCARRRGSLQICWVILGRVWRPYAQRYSSIMKNEVEIGVGVVLAVSRSTTHTFSKQNQESIQLLAGLGVEGDAHLGKTVKHRSRV